MDRKLPSERELQRPVRRRRKDWPRIVIGLLLLYLLAAYVAIPFAWERYARHHPSFDDDFRITQTHDGHPGDPLNVALIGAEEDLKSVMLAAGWFPATPLGLKSDRKIAADTVLSRPDPAAPVSHLYLYGRKEDLAFEKPVGHSPRQRNHVRFWRRAKPDSDGQTVWIGSATFDKKVGVSHTTGQVTHHIDADVDTERDWLFHDLEQTGGLSETYVVNGFHKTLSGHNGGGDPWHTDGNLYVGVIKSP